MGKIITKGYCKTWWAPYEVWEKLGKGGKNMRKPWTIEEDDVLRALFGREHGINAIQRVLKSRTESSIRGRLSRFGLSFAERDTKHKSDIDRELYENLMKLSEEG